MEPGGEIYGLNDVTKKLYTILQSRDSNWPELGWTASPEPSPSQTSSSRKVDLGPSFKAGYVAKPDGPARSIFEASRSRPLMFENILAKTWSWEEKKTYERVIIIIYSLWLLLLLLEDEPAPPDGPNPSDQAAASEPLDDADDESALSHATSLFVDEGSQDCAKAWPEEQVDEEENDSQRTLHCWNVVLPLGATHFYILFIINKLSNFLLKS